MLLMLKIKLQKKILWWKSGRAQSDGQWIMTTDVFFFMHNKRNISTFKNIECYHGVNT
jgi:hypothetical protein